MLHFGLFYERWLIADDQWADDKVSWRVRLLGWWWLNVYVSCFYCVKARQEIVMFVCGVCVWKRGRQRGSESSIWAVALCTGQRLQPLKLQPNPVKSSQFSNDGVMLVLEKREITERIKLQNPTPSEELHSPIFGPILLHISVSPPHCYNDSWWQSPSSYACNVTWKSKAEFIKKDVASRSGHFPCREQTVQSNNWTSVYEQANANPYEFFWHFRYIWMLRVFFVSLSFFLCFKCTMMMVFVSVLSVGDTVLMPKSICTAMFIMTVQILIKFLSQYVNTHYIIGKCRPEHLMLLMIMS